MAAMRATPSTSPFLLVPAMMQACLAVDGVDDRKFEHLRLFAYGASPIAEARWGSVVEVPLPGGGRIGIYEPKHPLAPGMPALSSG